MARSSCSGGDGGPAVPAVQLPEERIELGEGPIGHRPDRSERMVLAHPGLGREVAPHRSLLRVLTAHRRTVRRLMRSLAHILTHGNTAEEILTRRFSAAS